MGHSRTINCIGYAKLEAGKYQLYYVMSKLEIAQARMKAQKDGLQIEYWQAQTAQGNRILGCGEEGYANDETVKTPKMITCPICEGEGRNGRYYCPVCNGSGITRPGNEKKWLAWQLEEMKHKLA